MEVSAILAVVFLLSVFVLFLASYKFFSRMILGYRNDVHRRCCESENLKKDAIDSLLKTKKKLESVISDNESSLKIARQAGFEFIEKISAEIDVIAGEKMQHAVRKVELIGDNMKREFHKSVLSAAKDVIEKHIVNNSDISDNKVVDNSVFESSLDTLRSKMH